jgi:peptidoglycan DL-endopeptidase CwlO
VNWHVSFSRGRVAALAAIVLAGLLVTAVAVVPMAMIGGGAMLFAAGVGCPSPASTKTSTQPAATTAAHNSIPANYLALFQKVGQQYGVPWVILAGIGKVESDDGQSNLPGVHSGQNGFGAAGPMQIGIGGASGNTWGGTPIHPASEKVGVGTDEDGDGVDNVYDPADAIAGAAKYLVAHGVQGNTSAAIFAYNHLQSYVQSVLNLAAMYSRGGYTVSNATTVSAPECLTSVQTGQVPNQVVGSVISYARMQLGKPYRWGGTGPDSFDCSGLVMMAYRAAGINIPRTSEEQWSWGPRISASQVQPGDLVFFAGSDGTPTSPGHVGLVIGKNTMIEAYATGFPIRISQFGTPAAAAGDGTVVGFNRPWAHSGVHLPAQAAG